MPIDHRVGLLQVLAEVEEEKAKVRPSKEDRKDILVLWLTPSIHYVEEGDIINLLQEISHLLPTLFLEKVSNEVHVERTGWSW